MHCPRCGADAGENSRYCLSCGTTLGRGEAEEYIGRTIGRKYQVEALIGEGGMGRVFRARQVALDKLVVLKVLRQSLLSDERTVARFKREAKAASRLNHPNSISVLDFGQTEDGSLFIAMEFVPGQDLHTVLSKEGPLPEPRVVRLVSQVLSALYDAHAAGVIHRDLKPENIMVEQRRNEPDVVKVLDFGIAKIQDGVEEGPTLTRAGFVCGTPEYMSPEQARGAPLDHRSDLYAVGVILYQLVTGRLPFESDSPVGFATKHLTEEPLPPSRRRPDVRVSPGMERLILRALSKSPDDRPPDAEAFMNELLALEKERERRGNGPAASRRPASPAVLAPLPRRATPPPGGMRTEMTSPGWSAPEATVRASPERMQDRTRIAAPSSLRPPAPKAADETEAKVPTVPDAEGGFGFFKALTLTLVLVTTGLAGTWLYRSWRDQDSRPFVPPPNAPVPGQRTGGLIPDAPVPLFDQEIPLERRDAQAAVRLEQSGDSAFSRGHLDLAATEYKNAFQYNPTPELSLKLGEVYWQRGYADEARGWWKRHLRDQSDSKARALLQQRLPDLASAAGR